MPKMIIIRGLPGSGKTYKANELTQKMMDQSIRVAHLEADMFFEEMNENTMELEYKYNPDLKTVAHKWCQKRVESWMETGINIVVSNTFSQYWEMIPYFILARDFGYSVQVITCKGEYSNIHGVPDDVIQRMRERWED